MPDPELPDPALLDEPLAELAEPEEPVAPEEPWDVWAEEPEPPDDEAPAEEPADTVPLALLAECADPGSAAATTPAPTRPAAPIVTVAARNRARPRSLAATAAAGLGWCEFMRFPSSYSPQSAGRR